MPKRSPHRPIFKNTRRSGHVNVGTQIGTPPPSPPVLVLRGYVQDNTNLNEATGCVADPGGTYVYVMAGDTNGVTTVDVSDPDNPVVVGTPLVDGTILLDCFDGKHIGNDTLLVVSRSGDSVASIDVTTTSPSMIDSVVDASILNGVVAIDLDPANEVAFVIANNANRIVAVDYSNPASLSVISSLQDGPNFSNPWDIAVDATNQIAYLPSYNNSRINSVDISNPATMTLIQSKQETTHLDNVWGCALSADLTKLYVAGDGGRITAMDVSDPSNMTVIGTPLVDFPHLDGAQGILVYSASYIFVNAYFDQEVNVIDVSDPANIAYSSSIVDALAFDNNWGIDRLNNFLYIASDSGNTLAVVEIT